MGGVAAYSTLGWFSDPLLNTFIHRKDEQLAALMFHELAHKILYLPGDTTFNESFATAVEQYGVRLWMESKNAEEQFGLYLATKARRDSVVRLILEFRTRLQELYSENLGREPMRLEKAQLIADLRDAYSHLVQEWVVSPGEKGNEYRYWMETEVNNAKISAVGAYTDWVPAFARLLERGSSFEQFVEKARAISELAPAERKMELIKLASPSKPE
jgi:predicted aminopeptidase